MPALHLRFDPLAPALDAGAVARREGDHLEPRLDAGEVREPGVDVELDERREIQLGEHGQIGGTKHVRILQRLVLALGDAHHDHLGALAQVDQGRAAQVAHVLDEEHAAALEPQLGQAPLDHGRVEATIRLRVDLHDRAAGARDALGVARRHGIGLQHGEAHVRAQAGDGRLEQRRLACARGADEMDGRHPTSVEPSSISSRVSSLGLQQANLLSPPRRQPLDRSAAGSRPLVGGGLWSGLARMVLAHSQALSRLGRVQTLFMRNVGVTTAHSVHPGSLPPDRVELSLQPSMTRSAPSRCVPCPQTSEPRVLLARRAAVSWRHAASRRGGV